MKKVVLILAIAMMWSAHSKASTDRDCIKYTAEQASSAVKEDNNTFSATFSGVAERKGNSNADCTAGSSGNSDNTEDTTSNVSSGDSSAPATPSSSTGNEGITEESDDENHGIPFVPSIQPKPGPQFTVSVPENAVEELERIAEILQGGGSIRDIDPMQEERARNFADAWRRGGFYLGSIGGELLSPDGAIVDYDTGEVISYLNDEDLGDHAEEIYQELYDIYGVLPVEGYNLFGQNPGIISGETPYGDDIMGSLYEDYEELGSQNEVYVNPPFDLSNPSGVYLATQLYRQMVATGILMPESDFYLANENFSMDDLIEYKDLDWGTIYVNYY